MTRDPETGLWTLDGGSIEAAVQVIEDARNEPDEESIGDVSQRIVAAVLAGCPNAGDTMSAQDIAAALNTSPARIYKYLQRLSDASRPFISKPSRGRYGPPAPTGSMLPVGVKPPAQPPRQPPRGVPLIGNL